MPLTIAESGDFGRAVRRRIGQPMPAPAPTPKPPPPATRLSPPDPFSGLRGIGDAISGVGATIGRGMEVARRLPVVGGALDALGAVGDATVSTPVGLAALGADQFLGTGLTSAAQRASTGRPFWEVPKTAAQLARGALGQVAGDTSQDPFARTLAGATGIVQDVGSLAAPIPGAAAAARALGRLPSAAERSVGRAAPGAGALASRVPQAVTAARRVPKGVSPRVTTDATLGADLQASVDALAQKRALPPRNADTAIEAAAAKPTDAFTAQVQASAARQRAAPSADLSSRFPVSKTDTGTGVYRPPIAAKVAAAQDLSRLPKDVRAADEAAAAAGRVSPSGNVALEPPVPQGPIAKAGITGPLVGRAIGRNSSQLARAGRPVEGIEASADDIASSLKRQAKVHDANEQAIASARAYAKDPTPQNAVAHERSLESVRLLGGSLDHTAARIRAALKPEGLPAPTAADIAAARTRTPLAEAIRARTPAPAAPTARPENVIDIKDIRARNQATLDTLRQRIVASRAGDAAPPPTPPGPPAPPTSATPPPPQSTSGLERFLSVWNLPKALKASLDVSAPFRQGVLFSAGHPSRFFGSFAPMFRALASKSFAREFDAAVRSTPRSTRLYLAPLDGSLAAKEEAFMSNLAEKLPGVSASNRAYVTYLNALRAGVYDDVVAGWRAAGKQFGDADLDGLADVINHFTGRGDLPRTAEGATAVLNGMFFSPRFAISRVQSVGDALGVLKGGSLASQEAASSLAKFVGGGLAILTLAQLAGYKVESDPRSSSFGKIQVGPSQVDIWGGEQQIARYGAQLLTEERKTSEGKVQSVQRDETLGRFARSKLAPTTGALNDILGLVGGGGVTAKDRRANAGKQIGEQVLGRNFIGEPVTLRTLPADLFAPLGWESALEAYVTDPTIQGAAVGAANLLGVGANTFGTEDRSVPTPPAPPAPRATPGGPARLMPPGQTQGGGTRLVPPAGIRTGQTRLTPPTQGGPKPTSPDVAPTPAGGADVRSVISSTATASGIDPLLALAVVEMESGFDPYAVGDSGNSHGLFQENVYGRGAGRAPDYDPTRQTQRFAADVRRLLASGFRGTPGEIAAAAQRPADPAGYARKVDAIYGRMR